MYQNLVIVNKFCQFIARHYTEVPLYLELHTTGQAPVNFLRKHIVQLYISKTKTKKKNSYKGFMAYPLSQEFLCSPAKTKKEKKYMLLLFVVNLNNC